MTGTPTLILRHLPGLLDRLWRALPFALAAAMLASLMTCSPPQDLVSRVMASGTLRVATLNSPTTYYQTSSGASGFDFELAQHFAESLGVELELVVVDSHAAALQAVADGKAHVAAAGITVTDVARKRFDFGPTLQTVRAELVYRMGTPSPRRSTTLTAH